MPLHYTMSNNYACNNYVVQTLFLQSRTIRLWWCDFSLAYKHFNYFTFGLVCLHQTSKTHTHNVYLICQIFNYALPLHYAVSNNYACNNLSFYYITNTLVRVKSHSLIFAKLLTDFDNVIVAWLHPTCKHVNNDFTVFCAWFKVRGDAQRVFNPSNTQLCITITLCNVKQLCIESCLLYSYTTKTCLPAQYVIQTQWNKRFEPNTQTKWKPKPGGVKHT